MYLAFDCKKYFFDKKIYEKTYGNMMRDNISNKYDNI